MSTTTPQPQTPRRAVTVPLPDWTKVRQKTVASWRNRKNRTTKLSIRRALAFVAIIAMWAFGAYYGLIAMPSQGIIGDGLLLLALLAVSLAPFLMVLAQRVFVRIIGVLLAAVGGGFFLSQWSRAGEFFATVAPISALGLLLALTMTALVMAWLCRVPRITPTP